ncbi:hypothetical protein GGX14DRAFT_698299 [Mycena pura]|uniref:Methyltransferase domain-containing protein n=1 Tax=Mycena pura TaxID=153505 RepID=A0AAD6VB79_9AGAR|nr:hypothetical protein GGX14DRAFT_698299 [Mycena pura]
MIRCLEANTLYAAHDATFAAHLEFSCNMDTYFPPLDDKMWIIQADGGGPGELDFLRSQAGIHDADELKKHVIGIQTKAYEIYGYPCIRTFSFARLRISRLPAYPRIMPLLREQPDAILLDLGCCFGADLRKVAADGFPTQNLIGCDLRKEFWHYGHELFRSTPDTFPVAFLAGDVFDHGFLAHGIGPQLPASPPPHPLSKITSLTALNGHVSVIHVSYLFHLFSEQKQAELARLLAGLLAPLPGSMILGAHIGKEAKGFKERPFRSGEQGAEVFCHSPASWTEMWESVFPAEGVRVDVVLKKHGECHPSELVIASAENDEGVLEWSCTRL